MFDRFREKVGSVMSAYLHTPHDTEIVRNPGGPWSINDGVNYNYPKAVPARVREAGKGAVKAYLTAASKEFQYQFGTAYQQGQPITMPTTDILREWDWQTRRDVLENTHLAWARNPLAKAAVRYNRLFAIDDGVQITYQNDAVRELVEAFINHPDNMLKQQEKEWLETLQVDGELFFRKHSKDADREETGDTIVTTLLPWGVRAIKHVPGFFRRVTSYEYSVWESDGDGGGEQFEDSIPAEDVLHIAINKLVYEQRGRPELYVILTWLKAHKSLLEAKSRDAYFTSILYDVTLKNATGAQVAAVRNQLKEPLAGSNIAVHNDKQEWQKMETSRNGQGSIDLIRELKLMGAAGTLTPEYMLSDGENANLASATAQQLPALRKFSDFQDIMRDLIWRPLILWVLLPSIESGLLPDEVPQQDAEGEPVMDGNGKPRMIKTVDAFDVRYPAIEQDDPKTLGEALQIAVINEWMSNETAVGIMPFDIDYRAEQRKIKAERAAEMDEIRNGERPMPPNMMRDGEENADGESNDGSASEDKEEVS